MPSAPIPDEAVPFIFKHNALDWRGFTGSRSSCVCQHTTITRGDFTPLATDGVMCVVRFTTGMYDHIHLANIRWPYDLNKRSTSQTKATRKPKPSPLPNTCDEELARLTRIQSYLNSLASL